ncbi:unnamed protein product [Thelazia callipaeda]|uniref:C-type lectin domain-containing protein n=1 Tax=Thelazia callipaeda TaxID=103827 RepID=A0A0N5CVV1_THECL|nr:unnamed protein product [Thelazia callipaeda]
MMINGINVTTHDEAQMECSNSGAILVTIVNRNFNFEHPFWIGLSFDGRQWKWQDGTKLRYNRWRKHEPNYRHSCVLADVKSNAMSWFTADCHTRVPNIQTIDYVCQQ